MMNPELDLVFERFADVATEKVWAAWTQPERLKQWFTPAPWKTVGAEIDLRPGGAFRTIMRSPEGQEFPNNGCFLEIVTQRKLVWTNALEPGYRPSKSQTGGHGSFAFTAILTMEPERNGTLYKALVMHSSPADREEHEKMGYEEGWGAAFDQMIAMIKGS
jgi:uncharacterized protein YndB with AHSA1/START domain